MAGNLTLAPSRLVALCAVLGIAGEQLAAVEDADRLAHRFQVDAEAAARLRMDAVQPFFDTFGNAARIELSSGDLTEIILRPGLTHTELAHFTDDITADASPYEAHVFIDKTALATELAGADPRRTVRLYLFADALRRALVRGVTRFEADVWPHAPAPLVLAVADIDIDLTGPHLSVVGGAHLAAAAVAAANPPPDMAPFAAVIEARDRHVGWDTPWVRSLTPWHFELAGTCGHDDLGRLLRAQVVKLAVLFTCDRARARATGTPPPLILAEYRGREHVAVIPIDERTGIDATWAETSAVLAATDWCYRRTGGTEPDWVSDRLPFVQTRIAQTLEPHPESDRFPGLARAMPFLLEGIEWHWKAFIEGKVGEYLAGVQQVETTVADTVTSFADRSAALARSLSDTILAAVAVLIGSFIAAAFNDPFNATLFRIGVRTYAAYVLVFPGALGLFAAHRSLRLACAGFEARMSRFKETIYSGKVDEIAGGRVADAQRSFYKWLATAAVLYVAVALAAWLSADIVPDRVARGTATSPTTSTSTSTRVPTQGTVEVTTTRERPHPHGDHQRLQRVGARHVLPSSWEKNWSSVPRTFGHFGGTGPAVVFGTPMLSAVAPTDAAAHGIMR